MPLIKPRPLKVDITKCFLPADYVKSYELGVSERTVRRRMKGDAIPGLPTVEICGVEFIYLG